METKTIPFDLETAKKIQAGEIDGKIKTRCGYTARILCTDLVQAQPILAAFTTHELESVSQYTKRGCFYINGELSGLDLVIEVPYNEQRFKPFDKVLVRSGNDDSWEPRLFARYVKYPDKEELYYYTQDDTIYDECIPYEGNQELVGTTKEPKED